MQKEINMKVNDLTKESIKKLKRGEYLIFNRKGLPECFINIKYYKIYYENLEYNFQYFKNYYKDCEIFPIELIKKPNINKYEIHFCEGTYFMAKIVATESGIIDNTFTEFIGEFETNKEGIQLILNMLMKAYQLQKDFPLES